MVISAMSTCSRRTSPVLAALVGARRDDATLIEKIGQLDHEFVLATIEENLKHAEEMKKNPDMEHGGRLGRSETCQLLPSARSRHAHK